MFTLLATRATVFLRGKTVLPQSSGGVCIGQRWEETAHRPAHAGHGPRKRPYGKLGNSGKIAIWGYDLYKIVNYLPRLTV